LNHVTLNLTLAQTIAQTGAKKEKGIQECLFFLEKNNALFYSNL